MLNLDKANGQITNLNLRAEKHGDENQPACDIKIAVDLPAARLDDISPGLCESLYRRPASGDQRPLIEVGKAKDEGLTALRHPGLEPVKVKQKFPGYELTAHAPEQEDDASFFAGAEVKNFSIDAHEGGTATVSFSVGAHVDEDDIAGLLPYLRDPDAVLTLVPPKAQAQRDAEAAETCESAAPDCGPVEFHDSEGVPLCQRCWDSLDRQGTDPDDGDDAQQDVPAAA